jgi:hypothetical protein
MKLTSALVAGAFAALASATPAHASERDGVSCPANTDAAVSNGVLKCAVTLEYERGSVCPQGIYVNYTQLEAAGNDQCKPQGALINGKASVDSAMSPVPLPPRLKGHSNIPGDIMSYLNVVGAAVLTPPPASAYARVVSPTSGDKFIAHKVVHLWPKDMPIQETVGHDAKNGVACPSGFDTTVLGGRGLRCSDTVVKKAGCDAGWTIERKTGRDVCTQKDLLGNTVTGQYTIPLEAGYVGAMGNPAQHGWTLDTDRTGHENRDFWVKNGTVFRYPVAR